LSGGKANFRYLIDSHLDWAARGRIPTVEDLCVDLDQVATTPWGRLGGGCRAAFLHLRGRGDFLALQPIEIPPGAQMGWARHLYDEVFYMLSGHGGASVKVGEGETHRFEWGPRALFSPPLNTRYRLANLSGSTPARLICGNDLPLLMNVFRSEAFLFDHSFPFSERVGRAGTFAGEGDFLPVVGQKLTFFVISSICRPLSLG
jgi:quercetin dioxygenase-like cupin family protein